MRQRSDPSADLMELADLQQGVVTRDQILASGLSRHTLARLTGSEWQSLARGLCYTRRGEPPWLALAWAGVLLGGPDARLGFDSAGFLQGLVSAKPSKIRVVVPDNRLVRDRAPWQFRRETAALRQGSIGSPPRTRVEDTVLDLSSRDRCERVPHWLSMGVQSRRTTPQRLLDTVNSRQRVAHRARLLAVLQDVAVGADSPLEIDYLNNVERAHSLPIGVRQTKLDQQSALCRNQSDGQLERVLKQAHGLTTYRRDVLYPEFNLLVELDGRLGHEFKGIFRDMWRDNAHVVAGQPTLRYGWIDVSERACAAARQVALVLSHLGWTGSLVPCPRCAA